MTMTVFFENRSIPTQYWWSAVATNCLKWHLL